MGAYLMQRALPLLSRRCDGLNAPEGFDVGDQTSLDVWISLRCFVFMTQDGEGRPLTEGVPDTGD